MTTPRPGAEHDAAFMARALFLAERGRGRTTPNPIVGAVVVSPEGVVVGQGAHLRAGTPHAEIHALDDAGGRARGATLYCTLEPCSHVGRTGPCAHAIVAAQVARVVVAVRDPNPRVAGAGVAYLRGHGVEVREGVHFEEASRQNAAFFTWITKRRPFVLVKTAMSADGFVGRSDGPVKLTGGESDRWFHRQRAEVDAIAVGSTTVLVDDPWLTARLVYRERPLVRVIFDRRGRVSPSARVFSTVAAGPVIMIVSERMTRDCREAFVRQGVTVETAGDGLSGTLQGLGGREIVSLLVEGGSTLQQAFFDADLVDGVQLVITPRRLESGVPAPPALLAGGAAGGRRLIQRIERRLGSDTLKEFDVHRPD